LKELNVSLITAPRSPSVPTVRDWAAIGFRRGRLIGISFLAVFGGVLFVTWLTPASYDSNLEILVKRERIDPVLTADKNTQTINQNDVTEQDINSEVELLKSRDLLEKVVVKSGLNTMPQQSRLKTFLGLWRQGQKPDERLRTSYATLQLEKRLKVEPVKKTKLIKVTYSATDPQSAATVLNNLAELYLEKHLEVHRVSGAADFFQTQAEHYQQGLSAAQKKIAQFGLKGNVAPEVEKQIVLQKTNDFESELRQTKAAIVATQNRITRLEKERVSTPARLTTQTRTADNSLLLQQMRSTLLNLELKRTELLSKYDPTYKLVREVDDQISQARDALAKAEKNPVREEVTDRDTTHEWLTNELAKARAELTFLAGRQTSIAGSIAEYRQHAKQLNEAALVEQDLVRAAKTSEENFLLYTRKQEETRISEELDRQRIINVSVAELPLTPLFPSSPNWPLNLLLGFLLACFVSGGVVFAAEYMDRSFRTPEEVEAFLNIPVLVSLAVESEGR
jgi:uncharacterized protein involved in exopolysaccharide biosynthesis